MEQFKYIVSGVTFLKAEASQGLGRCNSACVGVITVVSGGTNLDYRGVSRIFMMGFPSVRNYSWTD